MHISIPGVGGDMYTRAVDHGGQMRVSDPPDLKLQAVVGCQCGCCDLNLGPPQER